MRVTGTNFPVEAGQQLLGLERGFWAAAGNRAAYAVNLDPDAIHVLPGVGVLDRESVLEGVEQATPWASVTIDDSRTIQLGPDVAAIVYRAVAQRDGQSEYRAALISIYRRGQDGWRLAIHQQTPLP